MTRASEDGKAAEPPRSEPKANGGGPPQRRGNAVKTALAWAAILAWTALIITFSGESFSDVGVKSTMSAKRMATSS